MMNKFSKKEIAGLVLIVLLSFIVNQQIIEKKEFLSYSNFKKNIIESSLVSAIFFIGFYTLTSTNINWRLNIWKILYMSSILIFIVFTIIDAFIYKISTANGQLRFNTFGQVLGGPIPYIALLLISKIDKKIN